MDPQSYTRLLNYMVCEMSMPVKKHVYNFALNDQISMNPLILSAAAEVAKRQQFRSNNIVKSHGPLRKIKCQDSPTNVKGNRTNDTNIQESVELYEGTEIEKGALEDIFEKTYVENASESFSADFSSANKSNNRPGFSSSTTNESSNGAQGDEVERNCVSPLVKDTADKSIISNENGFDQSEVQSRLSTNEDEVPSTENLDLVKDISELYSDPLLLCSDADFKIMFRLTRTTFQILVELLSKEEMEPIEDVPLYKKTLIVLWLLGNSGSYSDAAQVFGVSEETAANCFFDVCATLYNLSENFIRWPDSNECNEIASRIEAEYGFQGSVGILGCHYFSISIPKEAFSRREHFNANLRTYCISLQIVCDDNLVIRDIFPGSPGGIPPVQVLLDSPLCEQLTSKTHPHALVDPNKHILARSEYPQLPSMLTPYVKPPPAYLSKEELEFNSLHENVCLLVDQTFQMLQERFLTLKLLDPEVATMVLVTTCVLHNICVQNDDLFEPEETHEDVFTHISGSSCC